MSRAELKLRPGERIVRLDVVAASASSGDLAQHDPPETEWELVEEEKASVELVPSTAPAPLHLVRRSRLSTVGDWSPEAPIKRAYKFGQEDCQCALDGTCQGPWDRFPIRNTIYVILYCPSGVWPRLVTDLSTFYKLVKEQSGTRPPDRNSPWKKGIVSRGFASRVEAEAYLLGASCRSAVEV